MANFKSEFRLNTGDKITLYYPEDMCETVFKYCDQAIENKQRTLYFGEFDVEDTEVSLKLNDEYLNDLNYHLILDNVILYKLEG